MTGKILVLRLLLVGVIPASKEVEGLGLEFREERAGMTARIFHHRAGVKFPHDAKPALDRLFRDGARIPANLDRIGECEKESVDEPIISPPVVGEFAEHVRSEPTNNS